MNVPPASEKAPSLTDVDARATAGPADTFLAPEALVGRVISSTALLQGHDAVYIDHGGALYQLRATRQGKLILTK